MAAELANRHICFCGVTVIAATVCTECAETMVAALLKAASATGAIPAGEPDAEFAGAGAAAAAS